MIAVETGKQIDLIASEAGEQVWREQVKQIASELITSELIANEGKASQADSK